jgi:4-hydroxybenzoyl-CoA thioesterase
MNKIDFLKVYNFIGYPVLDTRARFHKPTRYGDDVAIETKLTEYGRSSFKVEHRLSKAGTLAAEGFETRVWAARDPEDPEQIKAQSIPEAVLAQFAAAG